MWTKICGVRDVATATAIASLHPTAIGLNFYPQSPRVVQESIAAEIVRALPDSVEPVGVFVNESVARIVELVERVGLRQVQLHGAESPEVLAAFQQMCPHVPLIRAWRMGAAGLSDLAGYLTECRQLGVTISACLVDAHVAGSYGGTGAVVPWDRLRTEYRTDKWPPLILAGGLHLGNVTAAIDAVAPWGVDVASGVESSPGVKDLTLVEQFLVAARA